MDTLRGHDAANDEDDFDYADAMEVENPPALVSDERRMQVRAYNYWASLLGDRTLPSIEDLVPDQLEDFGPHAVLLDFSVGLDNPAIVYLGTALRQECEIEGTIDYINDVPARSLLSRLTDHYLQIIANAAPIGFEAEFVNQRNAEIMYRGILMPFSSDDETIDFVFGVINWKEAASRSETETLEQEVGEALRTAPAQQSSTPIWADGPAAPAASNYFEADEDEEEDDTLDLTGMECPPDDASLSDWLALARDGAARVRISEARSHAALYRAVSLSYDFALVAKVRPDDYAELLADYGVKAQARSPMTAIIKLVFGATYDKTRITEYATALDHAMKAGLDVGALSDYLAAYRGGLKALVQEERAARKVDAPARPDRRQKARAAIRAAVAIDPVAVATDADGLAVVIARREADGTLAIVAALPEDSDLGQRVITVAGS
ncbi:PAS domain-containing protein [Sphingobium sp. YR768]|uniref:PAS domain-containing protein n=1 Tax=Sphingobium sp. YR768 TaxID=1884365 RepID=UPI0008BA2AD8|nr:hypothetical protein [Sphingobium sp. YR768]SEQ46171.1 hypothetical protein SAMN05518866_1018 [Sphingobium sp. YR768]